MTELAAAEVAPEELAREVGCRLAQDDVLAAAIEAFRSDTTFPESVHWRAPTVAQGHAGLAVLFGALDAAFPQDGWDRVGHLHLARAAAAAERFPWLDASLYTGVAGLGFAALTLAGGRNRYQRFLAEVDAQVTQAVRHGCRRLDASSGCAVGAFDLISGVTGMAVYLLSRNGETTDQALEDALGALARLILTGPGPVPRWQTPSALLGSEDQRREYPNGNLNCGLAHGIPGPLALLAVAVAEGHEPPGAGEAVRVAAQWLVEHRLRDPWGINWPAAVPLPAQDGAWALPGWPARAGWCYGAPGVARALWLAGVALGDEGLCALATEAMTAALGRPAGHRGLYSPNFCHGVAGLLHITSSFARDTGLPAFRQEQQNLVEELIAAYEPDSLLGFRNVEPGNVRVEHPGVLDGAPGVALALLAATGPGAAAWDRLFLLS